MHLRHKADLLLLTGAVAVTRFAFRSHYLYDIDSVNFALGIRRFDPRTYQPHPPGYFLYICLGRIFNAILHNANLALVALSIVSSCAVVILIYQMALDWFGPRAARFAALLFLLSPLAWFHGTVALTYSVEAFFSALLGYLCWRMDGSKWPLAVATGSTLGIAAGVRPSSLLFLGPLFLFSLRNASPKARSLGLAVLVLTLLAWFVPMVAASGGVEVYFGALFSLWRLVPSRGTVFNSSPGTSIARAATIVFIYLLGFGAASIAPLGSKYQSVAIGARKKIFTAVWVAPALGFFTFIFLKFVNSGYLLILAAPACVWLGFWMAEWYEHAGLPRSFKLALIGTGAVVNILIFVMSPLYCSYLSVRRFEAELEGIQTALPRIASPRDTLIVGFDSHFLGYRHAGYYLPDYLTVQYPAVNLLEGRRIFAMHGQDTELLDGLASRDRSYTSFVLFPLPSGDSSDRDYLQQVTALLPAHTLRTVHAGGQEFLIGPIAALPLLFPEAASRSGGALHP